MKTSSIFKRIYKDSKKISKIILLCFALNVLSIVISLLAPKVLGGLTNSIYDLWADNISLDMKTFYINCVILLSLYLACNLIDTIVMYTMNNTVSKHYTCALRIKMSDKIKHVPISYLDSTPNGEIVSQMTSDVSVMGNSIHNILNTLSKGFINLILIIIVLFATDFRIAIIIMVLVPLSLVLSAKLSSLSEKHYNKCRELNGKIYAMTEEDYTCFDTIKAFNLNESQAKIHAKLCKEYKASGKNASFLFGIVQPIIALTNNSSYIAICLIGGYLTINHNFSVGTIMELIIYSKLLAVPLENIAMGLSMMQNTIASSRRVYSFFDQKEMQPDNNEKLIEKPQSISFKNVNFSYDKNKKLITNLNLNIKAGSKVAIVGPTGGGKTTIVNLLMRFYEIDSGDILINNQSIFDMSKNYLRDMFGMVLQDTWLFTGSIYENIAYGKKNCSKDEVRLACKKACVDNFIATLPNGYETIINEDSTNISSGQKQLLTIARAYLDNKQLLILDEATSNIDTRTELILQKTMDGLMKGKTTFVIAHRLSTIKNADLILVLNDGSVIEQGTHDSLIQKGGFYYNMYNSQYSN